MPSAKEILKSLKRTNPSIWNDWRREKKNVPEELEKINFSELGALFFDQYDISKVRFTNCIFMGMNCTGCNFYHCFFEDCEIDGGSYINSNFENAFYKKVKFLNVSLRDSILSYSEFVNSDLVKINLKGASLLSSTFKGCLIEDCSIADRQYKARRDDR